MCYKLLRSTDRGRAGVGTRKRVLVVGRGSALLNSLALSLANNRRGDVLVAATHPVAMAMAAEHRPEIALLGASIVEQHGVNLKDAIVNLSPGTRVIIAKD